MYWVKNTIIGSLVDTCIYGPIVGYNKIILQVFGDMAAAGMDKDVGSALIEGANNLENLMGSTASLNKVTRTILKSTLYRNKM